MTKKWTYSLLTEMKIKFSNGATCSYKLSEQRSFCIIHFTCTHDRWIYSFLRDWTCSFRNEHFQSARNEQIHLSRMHVKWTIQNERCSLNSQPCLVLFENWTLFCPLVNVVKVMNSFTSFSSGLNRVLRVLIKTLPLLFRDKLSHSFQPPSVGWQY